MIQRLANKWSNVVQTGQTILFVFSVAVFLLIAPVNSYSDEKLTIHLMIDYPPYSWLEEGEENGIDVQILRELDRRIDMDLELKFAPWKRIISGLKDGTVEAAVQTWWRKERTQFLEYMSVPLRTTTVSIIGRKDSSLQIDRLSDFNGLRVGKMRAFSISSKFDDAARRKQFQLIEVDHLEQAIEMLKRDRLDLFVHSTSSADFHKKNYRDNLYFKTVNLLREEREGTYLVLSKQRHKSDATALINKLDKVVSQMHNDGTIAGIFKKFLNTPQ